MGMFGTIVATELAKVKRTATLWMNLVIPLLPLFLSLMGLLSEYADGRHRPGPPDVEWNAAIRPWWAIWTSAFLPLLIALEAAGITNLEHAGKNWKQLFALPIARWKFVAAKAVVCGLLIGTSFLIFAAGVLSLGLLRGALFHVDMGLAIPWEPMAGLIARAYLASSAAIVAQLWVSIRLPGFAASIGVGVGAAVVGATMRPFHLSGWWPWSMPFDSLPWGLNHVPANVAVAPLVCIAVVWLAGWRISRTEIL